MLSTPPLDRKVDNGHIDHSDHGQYRADTCTIGSTPHIVAHHQVADIDKPEDQGSGQLGVPDPPGAPDGLPPDCSTNQSQRNKNGPDFSRSARDPIPTLIASYQSPDTGNGQHHKGQHTNPCHWDVEIENALD